MPSCFSGTDGHLCSLEEQVNALSAGGAMNKREDRPLPDVLATFAGVTYINSLEKKGFLVSGPRGIESFIARTHGMTAGTPGYRKLRPKSRMKL